MTTEELEKIAARREGIETACAFSVRGVRILPTWMAALGGVVRNP